MRIHIVLFFLFFLEIKEITAYRLSFASLLWVVVIVVVAVPFALPAKKTNPPCFFFYLMEKAGTCMNTLFFLSGMRIEPNSASGAY